MYGEGGWLTVGSGFVVDVHRSEVGLRIGKVMDSTLNDWWSEIAYNGG